ncbi:hypothetical protein Dimus_006133, partial [Dionaea muscipula]
LVHSVMPHTSHSSSHGTSRDTGRGGGRSRVIGVAITVYQSSHRASSAEIDDYRVMHDYENMPTTDSSLKHPPLPTQ